MPYCPKCGSEYRPEIDTCSDCGQLLVPGSPPAEEDGEPSGLWTVIRYILAGLMAGMAVLAASAITAIAQRHSSPIAPAFAMVFLCVAGLFTSLVQPKPTLTRSAIVWFVPSSLPVALLLAGLLDPARCSGSCCRLCFWAAGLESTAS